MQTITTVIENTTVQELIGQFSAINDELLEFVEGCDQANWSAVTHAERWPICVTARHIAVAHYPIIEWLQMLARGESLPPVTMDMVNQLNAQHAQEHGNCTQSQVIELLKTNYNNLTEYLKTISDKDLRPKGYVKLFEADMSAADFFKLVTLEGTAGHLSSMKAT